VPEKTVGVNSRILFGGLIFWVQDWVQLKKVEWLEILCTRQQIGHLDFCPRRLLTEGLLVRI